MQASYISLYQSGELELRAQALAERLTSCDICPRTCRVNRTSGEKGYCRTGALPLVSSYCAHHGEEPAISGTKGSGTIFFAGCNLSCVYCQNYRISQELDSAREMTVKKLAQTMLYLQDKLGCHNINFVTPSHVVPQLVSAIAIAVPMGLKVPLVYNSSGYDSLSTIQTLDGIIDIYLSDLRYASDEYAAKYSAAKDYVTHSRRAVREMYCQVGNLQLDDDGFARRGLIVRHLILPNGLAGSAETLRFLATELSPQVTVSLMSQYSPQYRASNFKELARMITLEEYQKVFDLVIELEIENGWCQEMSARDDYLPDFAKTDPFAH